MYKVYTKDGQLYCSPKETAKSLKKEHFSSRKLGDAVNTTALLRTKFVATHAHSGNQLGLTHNLEATNACGDYGNLRVFLRRMSTFPGNWVAFPFPAG